MIIAGLRSSGSSPTPLSGAGAVVANGVAKNTSNDVKNVPKPSSTATAYGTTSRRRLRVRKTARLDQIESSQTQSSSEPSCEPHIAAAR